MYKRQGQGTAIAEPVHGAAPDIAGQGIANPLGAVLSAALLARHAWGRPDVADTIEAAVDQVLRQGLRTPDLAGPGEPSIDTEQMGQALLAAMA